MVNSGAAKRSRTHDHVDGKIKSYDDPWLRERVSVREEKSYQ